MNFSLDWFLSIPGLLITGGVLLLLIALIILIVTGRKKKDKGEAGASAEATSSSTTPQVNATSSPAPIANAGAVPEMNSPALNTGSIMDIPAPMGTGQMADSMNMNNQVPNPGVAPMEPMTTPMVQPTPEMPPVMGEPAMPTVEQMAPAMEQPVMPTVEQMAPTMEQPVIPTVEQQVPAEPVIYGGVNPIVPEMNIPETQHQIYGGANPLENTQSIPISNIVGPTPETVVQTPTPEPTLVVEQQAPVIEQPTNIGQ